MCNSSAKKQKKHKRGVFAVAPSRPRCSPPMTIRDRKKAKFIRVISRCGVENPVDDSARPDENEGKVNKDGRCY